MMNIDPMLIVRALQGILALIAMAVGATGKSSPHIFRLLLTLTPVANVLNTHNPPFAVPHSVIFFIFTAVFTLLITVPYTILTPRYFQVLAHPFAMLAAEATTSIFWLAGFAAFADFLRRSRVCEVGACSSARGSVVVGVLEL
jgi:hypothetical protein